MHDQYEAIIEVAKTTGQAIEAGKELGKYLSIYLNEPFQLISSIWKDKLSYIRFEQQIRLLHKTDKLLKAKGTSEPTKYIPLKIAIPLIYAGSLENDEWLQDQWAALLANAADATSNIEIRHAFISILEDLSHLDALIIKKIYSFSLNHDTSQGVWTINLPDRLDIDRPDNYNQLPPPYIETSLGNLSRLGLISSAMMYGGKQNLNCIFNTQLGHEFACAVSREMAN